MNETNYYLGVDIGTTSVKVVAFSATGEVLGQESGQYELLHPQQGWREQDPAEIFQATVDSINKVHHQLLPAQPVFVSFSAAMHSLILMDDAGKPLTNCIIWADNRAADIASQLQSSSQGKKIYQTTGVPVHAMSPLCKLLWLKKNDPELLKKANKFIGIKEYIFFRLFGEYVVDTSVATATALLNLSKLTWDEEILTMIGIRHSQLSQIVSVHHALHQRAENDLLQLPDNTPFIVGGSDGACANFSIGTASEHSLVITVGTSAAARVLTKAPVIDEAMRTFCYHAKENCYIAGGAGNNGAIVMEWLKDTLLESKENFDTFLAQAEKIPPTCEGLLFLPYILGERAPLWNAHTKGVFFGLSIDHTRSHMIRAAMESVIYSVYSIGKVIIEKKDVKDIYATGGFTQSELWIQMLADMFNRRVVISASSESSALGAVILGVEAVDAEKIPDRKIVSVFEPDSATHQLYLAQFNKFERIYEALKDEFSGKH